MACQVHELWGREGEEFRDGEEVLIDNMIIKTGEEQTEEILTGFYNYEG